MTKSPGELYSLREQRFEDAVALRKPDRVPVVLGAEFFMTRQQGLTNREAMYEYDRMAVAWKASVLEYDWDMAPTPLGLLPGRALDLLRIRQYKWPGQELPDDAPYQYVEGEYLRADEYDEFLSNPEVFTLKKLLPRLSGTLRPLAFLPPLYLMYSSFALLLFGGAIAGMQPMIELFDALQEVGREVRAFLETQARLTRELKALGYPIISEAICYAPFDIVGDCLRGMRGIMLDMYRQPDKLLEAIEFFTPLAVSSGITQAKRSGNPRVLMPLHKGAAGFMSNEQYARFYWPGLKNMILAQIDAGLTPVPFFEGDYTPRLEFLAELPKGKVCAWFDVVDLTKARDVLGDTMCFMGNLPPDLLILGARHEVIDYVKLLINMFGESGGLIINGAASGVPEEAKPDNVRAITEAVAAYGVNN